MTKTNRQLDLTKLSSDIIINISLRGLHAFSINTNLTPFSIIAILLRWAHEDIQTTVIMLLLQVYPIMLATAASINTKNLSLFDAHFAVAVTASPVSVYLAYSAAQDVFNRPNALFPKPSKPTAGKTLIRCLGLALPALWFAINLTISFSPRAFRNSPENCQKMTFIGWLEFQAVSIFPAFNMLGPQGLRYDLKGRGGLGAISLALIWIWGVYLVRHRYDILNEIRHRQERQTAHKFFRRKLLAIWNVVSASW